MWPDMSQNASASGLSGIRTFCPLVMWWLMMLFKAWCKQSFNEVFFWPCNLSRVLCPHLNMLDDLLHTPAAQLSVLLHHLLSPAFSELLHQAQQHHGNGHAVGGDVSGKLGPAQTRRVHLDPVDQLLHNLFGLELATQNRHQPVRVIVWWEKLSMMFYSMNYRLSNSKYKSLKYQKSSRVFRPQIMQNMFLFIFTQHIKSIFSRITLICPQLS